MALTPSDYTKRIENCKSRLSNGSCYNTKNPLRQHTCNGYCVEKLDVWLRAEYPEFDHETISRLLVEFTGLQTGLIY